MQEGDTPLHIAVSWGHAELARMMISRNADVKIRNDKRKTALDLATEGAEVKWREHTSFMFDLSMCKQGSGSNSKSLRGSRAHDRHGIITSPFILFNNNLISFYTCILC